MEKISGSWDKKFDYDINFPKFNNYLKKFNIDKYFEIKSINSMNLLPLLKI